jgi:tetratricopeptide (TPR) repeat protein
MMNHTANGKAAGSPGDPFRSLDALRAAHEELLETTEASGEPSSADVAAREQRIADFISRAAATGAILDAPADRKTAQGFIDYWVASLYTSVRPQAAEGGAPPPNHYSRPTRLAPFDAGSVKDVEQRGEQILAGLSSKYLELARRMLMHLVRLSERTGACVAVPVKRYVLLAQGELATARTILGRLIEARVLKQTPSDQGDFVELQYEALTRKWDRLSRWIEERMKFREAALFWDRGGRKRGALLGFGVAKKADAYGDLNELELEFLSESKKNSVVLLAAVMSVVVILLAAPPLSGWLYRVLWVPLRVESVTEDVKSKESTARKKSEGIRWLARNNQPLFFFGISLDGVDLSDEPLGDPRFAQVTLNNTKFDGAKIESGTFDHAIIAHTTFVKASLSGSSFDSALFCQDVDFSNTDLRNASVENVEFEKDTAPVVKDTAWWLARGWNWEQMEILRKQDQTGLEKTDAFKKVMDPAEQSVKTSRGHTLIRAFALNRKAWNLALFGLKLDDAEKAAREAVNIVTTLANGSSFQGEFNDTLGYILLQKGDKKEALEHLQTAVKLDPRPENLFRHAVAQFASGQEGAIKQLKNAMAWKSYAPNHELVRLRTHISGEFESELRALLNARRYPLPKGSLTCPPSSAPPK